MKPQIITRYKIITLCCLLFLSFPLSAQSNEDDEDVDVIAVTALRVEKRLKDTPVTVEVITQEEIVQSGASDVSDILEDYGILYGSNAMGDSISLQGMEGGQVLFLIDGRRISGRVAQNIQGATLPLGDVEQIEIIRGAQSALYGSDGMGGVINIITKEPDDNFSVDVSLTNSSLPTYNDGDSKFEPGFFDETSPFQSQNLTSVFNFGLGSTANKVTLEVTRTENYLDEDGAYSIIPEMLRGKAGFETSFPIGDKHEISIGGSYLELEDEAQSNAYGSFTQHDIIRGEVFVSSSHEISEQLSFRSQFYNNYYQRETSEYSALTDIWEEPVTDIENITGGEIYGTYQASDNLMFVSGVEALYTFLDREWLSLDGNNGRVDRNRESIIFQAEYYETDLYSVVLGLRGELDSESDFVFAPRIAGMYYITPEIRLIGGGGKGFRAPDFNELYLDRTVAAMPYVIQGNPDLLPEQSWGGNLGAEYSDSVISSSFSAYYNEIFDEIIYNYTGIIDSDSNKEIVKSENISRSLSTGIDMEGRINFLRNAFFSAGYSYLYSYDRTENEQLFNEPAHTARFKLGVDDKDRGLFYQIGCNYFSPIDPSSDVENYTTHRYSLDFNGSYRIDSTWMITLSLSNITGLINTSLGPFYGPKMILGVNFSI